MSINTQSFIMLSEIERTELCFIMKHVKVFIEFIVMNQLNANFILTMSERTKFFIFTFINISRKMRTKLFFISLILVKLLNSRVRISALISSRTFITPTNKLTHIVRIEIPIPFPIFSIVIIYTSLMLVLFGIGTRIGLKIVDIQILHYKRCTLTYFLCTSL